MGIEDEIKKLKLSVPLVMIIAGIGIFALFLFYLPAFSSFAASIVLAGIAFYLMIIYDNCVFKNIDTIQELKNGNVAVGLSICGQSFIIGCCILAAFIIFK